MASGVYAVAKASIVSPMTLILALFTLYLILRTKINPVFVILGSGMLGFIYLRFF
jgi:chromate transporter